MKKQAKFREIDRSLDPSESSWTLTGIFWNIPRNNFKHSLESFIAFPGIFNRLMPGSNKKV